MFGLFVWLIVVAVVLLIYTVDIYCLFGLCDCLLFWVLLICWLFVAMLGFCVCFGVGCCFDLFDILFSGCLFGYLIVCLL